MFSNKKYVIHLFQLIGLITILAIAYVYYFLKNYPLPITNHISLDAKIKFIRDNINPDEIDTIIVGSSIGLNNIQGTILEQSSIVTKSVLNFSVYESSTVQVEQILELVEIFPNLKRIIYSAQFSDIWDSSRSQKYDSEIIKKYMCQQLNTTSYLHLIFDASKNIPFLIQRQFMWKKEHMENNKFTYLIFDSSGSVPLNIYGKDIIKARWEQPHSIPKHTTKSYESLQRMMRNAHEKNIKFYLIQQPYRQALIQQYPHIKKALDIFNEKGKFIAKTNNQYFISLYKILPLGDEYFADRSHLNDKGSILTAETIGKYIDKVESNTSF